MCDRAVPISAAAPRLLDVSDGSDTSLPRPRVAVAMLPGNGARHQDAGETPEDFRAAAGSKGESQPWTSLLNFAATCQTLVTRIPSVSGTALAEGRFA
ncbi:hypothetical protein NDU88_002516 [Pleurodeles waltl]|uniref:Uncharacterized protein n=1 Tax=Pleurodeles waltl TaxID=8319 RepID=A0AAV7VZJ7_PLEWA|nr:hypothetical protein NDU88_002516 [Pleurodeles waltl]